MIRLIAIFIIVNILSSCSKDELITYEEGSGIYFDNSSILLDTITVPWGLKDTEIKEQKVKMEVHLFGKVVDYDRYFNVKVVEENTDTTQAFENIHYRPFPTKYLLKAGEAKVIMEITLLRDESLKKGNKTLTIALEESEELKFIYSRKTVDSTNTVRLLDIQRVIKMNENFPMPRWWSTYGTMYFGTWSMKKSILICDLLGINREKWVGDVLRDEEFNQGILKYAGVYTHRWLAEQNPVVLEDDGKPMEMGRDSKR